MLTLATIRLAGRPVGIGARAILRASAPALLTSALMALAVTGLGTLLPAGLPTPARLALLVAAGGACFLALLLLMARDTLDEIRGLLLRRADPAPSAA